MSCGEEVPEGSLAMDGIATLADCGYVTGPPVVVPGLIVDKSPVVTRPFVITDGPVHAEDEIITFDASLIVP